ncbi:MAG: glycosyltransferase family 2 protein [Marinosulfonomonas sp.]|nr:glycosyltransferase family 2 protein [Marinosulfonomonas sp.]
MRSALTDQKNFFDKSTPAGQTAPMVSIIVISYNTCALTLACLQSIYAQTQRPFEVIVVDNASTDGSAAAIKRDFPDVILLTETVNHGFGPAHILAVEKAQAPWLLLLNPDTVVLDGALDKLMDFATQTPDAGIWGGRTLYGDGSLNPTSCFARMTLWSIFCRVTGLNALFRKSRIFNSEYFGNWQRDTERNVDIVTGCLFLIERKNWIRLDGFTQEFSMYGEEVDLCLRARKIGLRPAVTPHATIIHYGGASQDVRSDKLVRLMKAKIELIKRHFPAPTRRIGMWMFGLWPLSRRLALTLAGSLSKNGDTKKNAGIWNDVWKRRAEWKDGYS